MKMKLWNFPHHDVSQRPYERRMIGIPDALVGEGCGRMSSVPI